MGQLNLFENSKRTEVLAARMQRKLVAHNEFERIKSQVQRMDDLLQNNGDVELELVKLLHSMRWGMVEKWNIPRPSTGDLQQAVYTALRFIVTSEMPTYKEGSEDGKQVYHDSMLQKVTPRDANHYCQIHRFAHSIFEAFTEMLELIIQSDNQLMSPDRLQEMVELKLQVQDGL